MLDHCMGMATDTISPPLQVLDEAVEFLSLLRRENVRSYLEIGVRYGGMLEAVMDRLPNDALGVGIDFPGGNFGDDLSFPILVGTLQRLKRRGRNVSMIFGPSAAPEVVERAKLRGPYDCVFIDADHSYEAVRRDFELYSPMGRMIVLHDIAAPDGHASRQGCQVDVGRFWREIKDDYRHMEIIAPGSAMGIGVLWK